MNVMNILHFGKYYEGHRVGGVEMYVDSLLRRFGQQHRIVNLVASPDSKRHQTKASYGDVIQVPSIGNVASTALCPTMPYWVWRLNKQTLFDIAHLHFPDPMAHLASFFLPKRVKKVVTWHSDIVRQKISLMLYKPFLKHYLNQVDAIIISNDKVASFPQLREWVKDQSKIHVIPIGIDVEKFSRPDLARVAQIKAQYQTPIIFALGRHVEYKGFRYLIEAMQQVPNATLVLGGSGPLTPELKALAKFLNVEDKVFFTGRISDQDIVNYYHAAEFFCMPSVSPNEAYGIVQLEAMACGKPVISCELNNGVSFVNQDQKTGFVIPPRDVNALAGAMNQLLSDPGLCRQMGEHAQARVQREFTETQMIQSTLALYDAVAQKRG